MFHQVKPAPRGAAASSTCRPAQRSDAPRSRQGPIEFHTFDKPYIDALVEQDPDTISHYVAYFGNLLRLKYRHIRSAELRQDVIQETHARVLGFLYKNKGLHNPASLGSFVLKVSSNVLKEMIRVDCRYAELPSENFDIFDYAPNPESRAVSGEQKALVRKVLAAQPERDQRLIYDIYILERDKDEVCKEHGVDRDYLRVLLHRAVGKLRSGFLASAKKAGQP